MQQIDAGPNPCLVELAAKSDLGTGFADAVESNGSESRIVIALGKNKTSQMQSTKSSIDCVVFMNKLNAMIPVCRSKPAPLRRGGNMSVTTHP